MSKKYETWAHDYLGLFYLAGALEAAGFEPGFSWKTGRFDEQVKQNQPDAVGFSCDFDNVSLIADLSREN